MKKTLVTIGRVVYSVTPKSFTKLVNANAAYHSTVEFEDLENLRAVCDSVIKEDTTSKLGYLELELWP